MLDSILDIDPTCSGVISSVYSIIFQMNPPSISIIKSAWEDDLGMEVWDAILSGIHSPSICARHGLLQFKVVHRMHLSKCKLAKIFPDINPICEHCKQTPATLFHMFWLCPSISLYWTSIFRAFSDFTGVNMEPTPLIGLLDRKSVV